jgi:hypothetical protein
MLFRRAIGPAIVLAGLQLVAVAQPADRLVLRNLDIITDRTVTSFDEDGLVLDGSRPDGGDRITWDEIERGKIALDQARFDKLLADLGPPLYRIRQRVKVGDYKAAWEPAELLYLRFAERKGQSAYLVCQATMWARLAGGHREAAVEPYLRCIELLRCRAATSNGLAGSRKLQTDATTAISPELPPVWFNAAAAKAALPAVQQVIRGMAQPRPAGAYIYYATLANAAGETAEADRVLPLLDSANQAAQPWADVVRAQQELASDSGGPATQRLKSQLDTLPESIRPTALLVVGQSDIRSADDQAMREGLLELLTLPAVYGPQQPELAAAALYYAAQAMDKLKDAAGATAVRRELTGRYASTQFGAKSRTEATR